MRLRSNVPAALITLMMISSCGVFGGGAEVTEDALSSNSTVATDSPTAGTVGSTGPTVGSTGPKPDPEGDDPPDGPSILNSGHEPPPLLPDQVGPVVAPLTVGPGSFNGTGCHGEFLIPSSALARLTLGDVLHDDVVARAKNDPTIMERLADLAPIIQFAEMPLPRDPLGPVTTIGSSMLDAVDTTLAGPSPGTLDPDTARLPSVTLGPSVTAETVPGLPSITINPGVLDIAGATLAPSVGTLDPDTARLPGVTLAPPVIAETIPAPPATTIPVVSQTGKVLFCGAGWRNSSLVQITIADPNGTVLIDRMDQAGDTGNVAVSWTPGLEHPIGRYTITVTDGSFTDEAVLDVVPPTSPVVDVLGPETVRPGEVVKIGFVGFQPGATVDLHILVADELSDWKYAGTIRDVDVGERGSTVLDLRTLPDDPVGIYCVWLDGTPPSKCRDASFKVATR